MVAIQRNSKAFEKLNLAIKQLDGVETKVGWFDSAKYPDGTSVAYVASIQELGYGPIPPRPFMRTSIMSDSQKWRKTAGDGAKAVLAGKVTPVAVMEALGLQAEGDISKTISQITSPALSPITIGLRAYKKLHPNEKITGATVGKVAAMLRDGTLDVSGVSTKPLNDTGHLIATLTSKTETT